MSEPKVLHYKDASGRPVVNVEFEGVDVTVFKSETDNKIGVLIDTNNVDQSDTRVYLNNEVIHGGPLYDIHDMEKNFSVVFSHARPNQREK